MVAPDERACVLALLRRHQHHRLASDSPVARERAHARLAAYLLAHALHGDVEAIVGGEEGAQAAQGGEVERARPTTAAGVRAHGQRGCTVAKQPLDERGGERGASGGFGFGEHRNGGELGRRWRRSAER